MRALGLLPLLALLACSADPAPAPAAPAVSEPSPAPVDIRGRITQVHRSAYGEPPLGSILVEGSLEADTRHDKANVRITRDTKVARTRGGNRIPFNQLKVGDLVEVIFTGPVAESYPVQATAAEVVLLGSKPVEQ